MARVCGPILGFRGEAGERWQIAVLVVHADSSAPGDLSHSALAAGAASIPPQLLGSIAGMQFFGYLIAVEVGAEDRRVDFRFAAEDRSWTFAVPARGRPPRIAYASCNGFSLPGDMKKIADKNAMWMRLLTEHARQPFHLLLMGGDQIYADQCWDALPELRFFNELPRQERVAHQPGAALAGAVLRFYAETYRDRFAQAGVAEALASIPTVMMWDDHDIFDGWGSYSDEEQASPTFRVIFEAARTTFALFQRQSDPAAAPAPAPGSAPLPGFNAFLRLRTLGLLVLDLRSERSQRQVLSLDSWNVIFAALDRTEGLQHLLLMSSIPVVHPNMSFLERAFGLIPGMQENEDDLHDQWLSYNHRTERLRLIHRLLDFAEAKGTRVTILSGDVHVGALGVIESARRPVRWLYSNVINQLTSSAIVHPPPPRIVRLLLEQLGTDVQEVDRDIRTEMLKFPGTESRILAARNWLSLEFDERGRIWANWDAEELPELLTKVIHPCERQAEVAGPVPPAP